MKTLISLERNWISEGSRLMKTIKLTTGQELALDGDLLSLIESIYQETALRKELKHNYEDVMKEIENILRQLTEEELHHYFKESIFLNTVTYENEMLDAYLKRLSQEKSEA
jgi:hypothetical protein